MPVSDISGSGGRQTYVIGASMVPFGNHGPGVGITLGVKAAVGALADAQITFADVEALYGGSAGPLTPRVPMVAQALGLTGIPIQQIVNASATGLAAIHEGYLAIRSGAAKIVLVVGYDSPTTAMSPETAIVAEGNLPPVASFALLAQLRMAEMGTTREHLAMIAAKNWNYARSNPFAARRAAALVTPKAILSSRVVADPLNSMMCTSWGEGAAAVVLCSDDLVARFSDRPLMRLAGSVMGSEGGGAGLGLDRSIAGSTELTRRTAEKAYKLTGIKPTDVDVVQVHDAFAIEELLYYELLGFSKLGETERLIEAGGFGPGSRQQNGLPEFSTDGGLIARGHPGGATGVAQVWETRRRLCGPGDDRIGMCHLIGAGSVSAVQLYERVGSTH